MTVSMSVSISVSSLVHSKALKTLSALLFITSLKYPSVSQSGWLVGGTEIAN
jgi:hypothetical protein